MARQRIRMNNTLVWHSGDDPLLRSTTEIIEELDKIFIDIIALSINVYRHGVHEYHEPIIKYLIYKGKLKREDIKGGRRHLHRLIVNYIRHGVTVGYDLRGPAGENRVGMQYRGILDLAISIAGFHLGYQVVNDRLLDVIKGYYPILADECDAQKCDDPLIMPADIFRIYSPSGGW